MCRHLYISCKITKQCRCGICPNKYATEVEKERHEEKCHQIGGAYFQRLVNAFRCEVFEHRFNQENSVEGAFVRSRLPLLHLLQFYLRRRKLLKYRLVVMALILKTDGTESEVPMRTTTRRLLMGDYGYLEDSIQEDKLEIQGRQEGLLARTGSGESLLGVTSLRVELGQCDIFGGHGISLSNADLTKIPGFEHLQSFENTDNLCFYYCVAYKLIPSHVCPSEENAKLIMEHQLTYQNTAMKLSKIRYFEKANEGHNFGINVFYHEGKMVYPVYRSIFKDGRKKINLLLIKTTPINENSEESEFDENAPFEDDGNNHFVLINNLDKFMTKQMTLTGRKLRQKVTFCENCLLCFYSNQKLRDHQELCFKNKEQKVRIPKRGTLTVFKNHMKKFPAPFIGFCDFEAILQKRDRQEKTDCLNCQQGKARKLCDHATHILNDHIPVGFSLIFVDHGLNIVYSKKGHGDNCMSAFFEALEEAGKLLLPLMNKESKPKPWSSKWEKYFLEADICHICEEPFDDLSFNLQKVRDHDHFTGKPLGAAHNQCNRLRRSPKKLTVYVHNLAGYDSHFILHNFDKKSGMQGGPIRAIPINSQKFRTLEFSQFLFLDSLALLDAPLDKLVENLLHGNNYDLKVLKSSLIYETEEQKQLLLRKGVFPYEWCDSYDKLVTTTEFPPHNCFYSNLKEDNISLEDYNHGKRTFQEFGCKNMLEYMSLYCMLDTVLLAECVMRFRYDIQNEFDLSCENYVSLPQLAFDCMLRSTGAKIEQMSDKDMIYMIENGIRGGVSYINTRHVNVENTYNSLTYIDMTNLYGFAQKLKMPISHYRWLSETEISQVDFMNIDTEGEYGMIIECDLEYPEDLHLKHESLPLCPESLDIFYPDLSTYSQDCLIKINGLKKAQKYHSTKLCGTFKKKIKYVTHFGNLKFYLEQGMTLTKIHRVLHFRQEAFIEPFITHISTRRALAKTEFEKTINKLIVNATFGKWLQDVRKHIVVKLVNSLAKAQKWIGSPHFISYRIISESLIAVFLRKKEITLDRNYLVGFTILELSKRALFKTFYEDIQPKFDENQISVVMSDTDSLILHCNNHSTMEVMRKLAPIMDFSNLPKDHPLYSEVRKQVPGFMKNETPTDEILEIVAPKSKCYFLKLRNTSTKKFSEIQKCKGVTKAKTRKLVIEQYKKCIYSKTTIRDMVHNISVRNNQIRTTMLNKICMSSFDDKRHLLNCGVHSVPYGSIYCDDPCAKCLFSFKKE